MKMIIIGKPTLLTMLYQIKNYKYRELTPVKMRHDDVYLVSYPRSGNTWLSFMLANTIIECCNLNKQVNFFNIHDFVPDIHISRYIPENLEFRPFPRIIKSHSNFNPYYKKIIWLVRNPGDVLTSFWHYRKDLYGENKSLSEFVRDKKVGIEAWLQHISSWLNPISFVRIKLVKFENLKEDPQGELLGILHYLGIPISGEIARKAIKKSSFENMKRLEKETMSYIIKQKKEFNFVREGKINQKELNFSDWEYIKGKAGKLMKHFGYL